MGSKIRSGLRKTVAQKEACRDTKAAKRLLLRLLKKQGLTPKRIITDKLRSYRAAKRNVMPSVEHRSHKGLNNRAENSHLPLRKRERMMQGFRSVGGLQRFVSIFSVVSLPRTTPEVLSSGHPHSPYPRHGAVESCDRRTCLIYARILLLAWAKQRDNASQGTHAHLHPAGHRQSLKSSSCTP